MQHRMLGERTRLKVSHLALGTGMFGTTGGRGAEPEDVARIFHGYAETSGNVVDTSAAYQLGPAETLVGEFTATGHDKFIIAFKYSRGAAAHPSSTALSNNRKRWSVVGQFEPA